MKCFLWVLLVTFALCVAACRDDNTTYDAFFWTSIDTTQGKLMLFVDGASAGTIPYFATAPACGNNGTLHMTLQAGKHKFEAMDLSGNIRSSHTCKINSRKLSTSGTVGGAQTQVEGNCLIVGLFY